MSSTWQKFRKSFSLFMTNGLVLAILLLPTSASALDPIPADSGFSGFLRLGAGVLNYSSNMVAGNGFLDITDDTITSNTSGPDDETEFLPVINGELAYTFASTRTQITLGSQIEDIVRLETAQQLAVKQELPDKSIISLGVLFSGMPTEVWKDPYLENSKRQETDRDSRGIKFAFDGILGSNFEFVYSYRDIDIDDEQSGNSQGLTAAERDLLRRDGDSHKATLLYRFDLNNGHFIEPGFSYFDYDRDGNAMAHDGYEVQLTYFYLGDPLTVIATGMIGNADFDAQNPIYNKTREDDLYLLGLQVYYKEPFGWKPFENASFSVYCGLSYYNEDSNINFYDAEMTMVDAGVLFRF